jgi:glycosyltransferase involved in cell wall biosynthesis
MAKTVPAVSVAMPVYNGARYVREAVASLLAQTCTDFELVIVDDGSTDATPEILKEVAARDRRVVIHRQSNAGHTAARNLACRMAHAPLIACFDADDIARPERLGYQHDFLVMHPAVAAVGGGVELITDQGRTFATRMPSATHVALCKTLERASPFFHSSVMVRKDAFEAVGGYRPQFGAADDYDLWLRLSERYELAGITQIVGCYRVHPSMMSAGRVEEEGLLSIAARLSASARVARKPDPLAAVGYIDREMLLRLGVAPRDITEAIVDMTTWLAKTLGRAGYDREDTLFFRALALARAECGSPALVTNVLTQRAIRLRERGRPWRAAVDWLCAQWVCRTSRRLLRRRP